MLKLKGCPRCHGDVIIERDYHGWYEHCMLCGYQRDLPDLGGVRERVRAGEEIRKMTNPGR